MGESTTQTKEAQERSSTKESHSAAFGWYTSCCHTTRKLGIVVLLTASYSIDTVYALATTGMAVHLLACDNKFANGFEKDDDDTRTLTRTTHHPRPMVSSSVGLYH